MGTRRILTNPWIRPPRRLQEAAGECIHHSAAVIAERVESCAPVCGPLAGATYLRAVCGAEEAAASQQGKAGAKQARRAALWRSLR